MANQNQKYIQLKINALETEIKTKGEEIKQLKTRLAGYKAQLAPQKDDPQS